MEKLLVSPPVVFIIILIVCWILSFLFSKLAIRSNKPAGGKGEAYACGEDTYNHLAQPDYSNFFPYAFFFTLAHVATLIITTGPVETVKSFVMAALYILGAIVGLFILLRK
jgi:NADH:ubiquinone oxidoreductase subunit 3 (subunit A)